MPLFEVAIIKKPTKKEAEEGAVEVLLFGPKSFIARNDQGAGMAAAMSGEIPPGTDMNQCEVIVRPFA